MKCTGRKKDQGTADKGGGVPRLRVSCFVYLFRHVGGCVLVLHCHLASLHLRQRMAEDLHKIPSLGQHM